MTTFVTAAPSLTNSRILRPSTLWLVALALGWMLLATGCTIFGDKRSPGFTSVATESVRLPAHIVSNFFLVDARQADGKTYRFMVDTGSSATLVSPAVAAALGVKPKKGAQPHTLPVRSADGRDVELPAATLRNLVLGGARFERVPAGVNDFTDLSNHLGFPVDGVLGFPLFRGTILTLDYPTAQLGIEPNPLLLAPTPKPSPRTSTLVFDNEQGTPLIPVQMGTESFNVLIDSGSAVGLNLNPSGLHPHFVADPRPGKLSASLGGDRQQLVGRLSQNLLVGNQPVTQPVADLTDQLSSLGGEVLRHFTLVFDQRRNLVTFVRESDAPVQMGPRRDTGLSFRKFPTYWQVLAVVPDSPASGTRLHAGDVCVRINGEPVAKWDYQRYADLLRASTKISYTFVNGGADERTEEIPVFDLVP